MFQGLRDMVAERAGLRPLPAWGESVFLPRSLGRGTEQSPLPRGEGECNICGGLPSPAPLCESESRLRGAYYPQPAAGGAKWVSANSAGNKKAPLSQCFYRLILILRLLPRRCALLRFLPCLLYPHSRPSSRPLSVSRRRRLRTRPL